MILETLTDVNQTRQRYISEDRTLRNHQRECQNLHFWRGLLPQCLDPLTAVLRWPFNFYSWCQKHGPLPTATKNTTVLNDP
jgi:hypothetical protein